jgi:hypothetical protein
MNTRQLIILVLGFVLVIAGELIKARSAEGGDALQGLGTGFLLFLAFQFLVSFIKRKKALKQIANSNHNI